MTISVSWDYDLLLAQGADFLLYQPLLDAGAMEIVLTRQRDGLFALLDFIVADRAQSLLAFLLGPCDALG